MQVRHRFKLSTLLATVLLISFLYCDHTIVSAQSTSPTNTIVENAIALRDVIGTRLQPLMTAPEFADVMGRMLDPASRSTVFIPVEEATRDMNIGPEQASEAIRMLRYHVVDGAIRAQDIPQTPDEISRNTLFLNSPPVRLSRASSGAIIVTPPSGKTSTVVLADIICSNGVIHLLDSPIDAPGVNMDIFRSTGNTVPGPGLPVPGGNLPLPTPPLPTIPTPAVVARPPVVPFAASEDNDDPAATPAGRLNMNMRSARPGWRQVLVNQIGLPGVPVNALIGSSVAGANFAANGLPQVPGLVATGANTVANSGPGILLSGANTVANGAGTVVAQGPDVLAHAATQGPDVLTTIATQGPGVLASGADTLANFAPNLPQLTVQGANAVITNVPTPNEVPGFLASGAEAIATGSAASTLRNAAARAGEGIASILPFFFGNKDNAGEGKEAQMKTMQVPPPPPPPLAPIPPAAAAATVGPTVAAATAPLTATVAAATAPLVAGTAPLAASTLPLTAPVVGATAPLAAATAPLTAPVLGATAPLAAATAPLTAPLAAATAPLAVATAPLTAPLRPLLPLSQREEMRRLAKVLMILADGTTPQAAEGMATIMTFAPDQDPNADPATLAAFSGVAETPGAVQDSGATPVFGAGPALPALPPTGAVPVLPGPFPGVIPPPGPIPTAIPNAFGAPGVGARVVVPQQVLPPPPPPLAPLPPVPGVGLGGGLVTGTTAVGNGVGTGLTTAGTALANVANGSFLNPATAAAAGIQTGAVAATGGAFTGATTAGTAIASFVPPGIAPFSADEMQFLKRFVSTMQIGTGSVSGIGAAASTGSGVASASVNPTTHTGGLTSPVVSTGTAPDLEGLFPPPPNVVIDREPAGIPNVSGPTPPQPPGLPNPNTITTGLNAVLPHPPAGQPDPTTGVTSALGNLGNGLNGALSALQNNIQGSLSPTQLQQSQAQLQGQGQLNPNLPQNPTIPQSQTGPITTSSAPPDPLVLLRALSPSALRDLLVHHNRQQQGRSPHALFANANDAATTVVPGGIATIQSDSVGLLLPVTTAPAPPTPGAFPPGFPGAQPTNVASVPTTTSVAPQQPLVIDGIEVAPAPPGIEPPANVPLTAGPGAPPPVPPTGTLNAPPQFTPPQAGANVPPTPPQFTPPAAPTGTFNAPPTAGGVPNVPQFTPPNPPTGTFNTPPTPPQFTPPTGTFGAPTGAPPIPTVAPGATVGVPAAPFAAPQYQYAYRTHW